MITKLFSTLNADSTVTAVFGSNPLRVYPYGTKFQKQPALPYAIYSIFNASPYNYLQSRTDMDLISVQLDVYAKDDVSVRNGFNILRTSLEKVAYLTGFSTPSRDPDDALYHVSMEFDFHEPR